MTTSSEDPPPGATSQRTEGTLERGIGVITAPVRTLRDVTATRRVGEGLVTLLIAGAAGWSSSFAASAGDFGISPAGALVLGAVLGLIFVIPAVAAWAGICHLVARMLGQRGTYSGLLAGMAYTSVPFLLLPPMALIALLGVAMSAVGGAASTAISIWVLVLEVVAIRENYKSGTGTTIGVVLLALLAIVLFFILLILVIVMLVLLGLFALI